MEQLNNMDLVYQNAWVTIVAAAGEDAHFGLPGVGGQRRLHQPSAKIGDEFLVSTLPDLSTVLGATVWATRGWTYQEDILSTRRLYFTEHQVYYKCQSHEFCEAVENDLRLPRRESASEKAEMGWKDGREGSPWGNIEAYTKRNLTHGSDILKALSGILAAYARSRGFVHAWGLPVAARSMERWMPSSSRRKPPVNTILRAGDSSDRWMEGIISALCWSSHQPCTRREGFPSWTWLGWEGQIQRGTLEVESTRNVEICLELDGQKTSWDALKGRLHHGLELGQTLHIKGRTMQCSFSYLSLKDPEPPLLDSQKQCWWAKFPGLFSSAYVEFKLVKKADPGSEFYSKLGSQKFTGIVLGNDERGFDRYDHKMIYCPVVLVVDNVERKWERIGYFSFRYPQYVPESSERQFREGWMQKYERSAEWFSIV